MSTQARRLRRNSMSAAARAAQEKRIKIHEHRVLGWTCRKIAREFGWTEGSVKKMIQRDHAKLAAQGAEAVEYSRRVSVERAEGDVQRLRAELAELNVGADPEMVVKLIGAIHKPEERIAKLLGLNAPTAVSLTAADAGPLVFKVETQVATRPALPEGEVKT